MPSAAYRGEELRLDFLGQRLGEFWRQTGEVRLRIGREIYGWGVIAVDGWLPKLERRSLYRGIFTSVKELKEELERYLRVHSRESAKPIKWTKDARTIQTDVGRARDALPN